MLRLLAFACLFPVFSFAQNLVVNGSFESLQKGKLPLCQYSKKHWTFNREVTGWSTFEGLTPDIIQRPDTLTNCIYPNPHTGKHLVGIINYHPAIDSGYDYDYHEYIQGSLKEPLVPGQLYKIELWILQADKTGVDHLQSIFNNPTRVIAGASNNLGILFQTSKESEEVNFRQAIKDFDIRPQVNFDELLITPEDTWVKISTTFTASQPYQYFIIGNFFLDDQTQTNIEKNGRIEEINNRQLSFYNKVKRIAYYCLDDIHIEATDVEIIKKKNVSAAAIALAFTDEQPYVFQNLVFETQKWDLPNAAQRELNLLAEYIRSHPEISVEIGGHTDQVGSAEENQLLSEKRARAVYDYLVNQLESNMQLSYRGYGESKPVASNETSEGRAQNRRVECVILQ